MGDFITPLQVDVRTLHAGQRGAAGSVLKESTKKWMESEAGLEWRKERRNLFSAEETVGVQE